jgi:hypothetical protein
MRVGSNVVVEWLALLLRIREVPVSNLGPETFYLGRDFSQYLQENIGIVP